MDTDRNLLFAVLALQADLLDRDQFVQACTLWTARKHTPLADLLVEQGWLTAADRADVERLLGRTLKKHGGDVRASLAEAAGHQARSALATVDDADVQQSVAVLPSAPPAVRAAESFSTVPPSDTAGRNILYEEIGRGGMGCVRRGHDPDLRRDLAVKVLHPEYRGNAAVERRFVEEAQVGGQLQHPGVVPVHDLGRCPDGRSYFTMKLVKGRTLAELLKERPDVRHDQARFLAVFEQVCQTVAYAHSKGVLHRDLKPRNIMVGAFGEVQVMDWGLAKVLASRDRAGADPEATAAGTVIRTLRSDPTAEGDGRTGVVGTPAYWAPEQARGEAEAVDERADVFGLGGLLCVILTGQPPWAGADREALLRKAAAGDLAEAFARLDGCGAHPELVALCQACLAPRREGRPRDAGEVAARLAAYLAGVQERLRQAELAEAEARARAEEEERTRRVAERMAEVEMQARLRMRRLLVGLAATVGLFLLALLTAGIFAWRAHNASQQHLADTIDKALTAAMGGDLEAAERAIAEAESDGASTGQVRMLRGQIALHRGRSQEAMGHLEQAVRLLPDSVAARGMLAAAYASDGHWERYNQMIKEMEKLSPSTPEDFLFQGYAEGNLDPELGLQRINKAFELRPKMLLARLLRSEIRAYRAQDTDDLEAANDAVADAEFARDLLGDNPAALWECLNAHLAKAGVHGHRAELEQRRAELELAEKYADALKRFTAPPEAKDADALKRFTPLPEAVVYRWLYFREVGRAEEVLKELRCASEQTDHVYVAFCCALTLYRRGGHGDLEEALGVLKKNPDASKDSLRPFVLAELDYDRANPDWQARALQAFKDCADRSQNGNPLDSLTVLYFLGRKEDAVKASKEWQKHPERIYPLRQAPILRCVDYYAGDPREDQLREDQLVEAAQGSQWDQCLAHYSVAMKKLAEGDRKGAQQLFDKVVKTRAFIWGAYDMSWVFQSRLANGRNWPPWIPSKREK
jgi:tetratricopeptide (TPR) repeat protein